MIEWEEEDGVRKKECDKKREEEERESGVEAEKSARHKVGSEASGRARERGPHHRRGKRKRKPKIGSATLSSI